MVHKGFSFIRHRELKNGQLVWLCIKRKKGCNAKIYSAGERVVRAEGEHHHPDVLLQESKYSESSSEKSAATTAVQAPSVQAASVQQEGQQGLKEDLKAIQEEQRKFLEGQKQFLEGQRWFLMTAMSEIKQRIGTFCTQIDSKIQYFKPIDDIAQAKPRDGFQQATDVQEVTANII
jgi:hypothetical protein